VKMQQCRLSCGTQETQAWIDARAAKEGNQVELLPGKTFWRVDVVYNRTLDDKQLCEIQMLNRHSLPSVEPIK
jgi:hypothetical protein